MSDWSDCEFATRFESLKSWKKNAYRSSRVVDREIHKWREREC